MLPEEWQCCLAKLDTNPQAAQSHLYNILQQAFGDKPPRLLSWWIDTGEGENSQEFVHHLWLHLCEIDFKRLRKYPVATSPPPDRWLRRVANNRIKDDVKRRRPGVVFLGSLGLVTAAAKSDFVKDLEDREAVAAVERSMRRLSEKERLLVQCRVEERFPGETAVLTGLSDTPRNRKRTADATGYAIEKLVRFVRRENREVYRQLAVDR